MNNKKQYLKIALEDGKFVSHEGVSPEYFSEKFVNGNGWRAISYDDGSIRCNYILRGKNSEKIGEVLFKITKEGYVILNKRMLGGELTPLTRTYKLPKCPTNGFIGLVSGGDGPYAYYHKWEYDTFLSEHGISKVQHENPNQFYTLYNLFDAERDYMQSEDIMTDGIAFKVGIDRGRTEKWQAEDPDCGSFELYEMFRVENAKWVIIKERSSDNGIRRTLITMTEVPYLTSVPKRYMDR